LEVAEREGEVRKGISQRASSAVVRNIVKVIVVIRAREEYVPSVIVRFLSCVIFVVWW